MGRNNEIYRLYQEMLDGYNSNNETIFAHGARCLMALNPESPFSDGTAENEYFGRMYINYQRWNNKGVDTNVSYRRLVSAAKDLCAIVKKNPYAYSKKEEQEDLEKAKEIERKEQEAKAEAERVRKEEEAKAEQLRKEKETETKAAAEKEEDVNYLLTNMVNAYLRGDNASYEMYVIHIMDNISENPFKEDTKEYELFAEMKDAYTHNPPNKRRTFVVGKELCELINNTEIYPEKIQKKETVLGVMPEEKKSWLRFLFPWRKEGEQDDSKRAN